MGRPALGELGLLDAFHQTLKNEEVYWKLYQSPVEARGSLEIFRCRYNVSFRQACMT